MLQRIAVTLAVSVALVSAVPAVAQEPEGLIPRLMKKFKKAEPSGAQQTKPAVAQSAAKERPAEAASATRSPAPDASPAPTGSGSSGDKTIVSALDGMSKDDMVKEIIETVEDETEILDYIPQVIREKQPDESFRYLFRSDTKTVPLDQVAPDTLRKLLTMVHQTATRIRTERITRQLETIRQTQRVLTAPPVAPAPPPAAPPSVAVPRNQPVQPPPAPPTQSSVPRTPPSPVPQPPRR